MSDDEAKGAGFPCRLAACPTTDACVAASKCLAPAPDADNTYSCWLCCAKKPEDALKHQAGIGYACRDSAVCRTRRDAIGMEGVLGRLSDSASIDDKRPGGTPLRASPMPGAARLKRPENEVTNDEDGRGISERACVLCGSAKELATRCSSCDHHMIAAAEKRGPDPEVSTDSSGAAPIPMGKPHAVCLADRTPCAAPNCPARSSYCCSLFELGGGHDPVCANAPLAGERRPEHPIHDWIPFSKRARYEAIIEAARRAVEAGPAGIMRDGIGDLRDALAALDADWPQGSPFTRPADQHPDGGSLRFGKEVCPECKAPRDQHDEWDFRFCPRASDAKGPSDGS